MTQGSETDTHLQRSLSLPLITFYGLGTILGAGIYVLIGEVAATAGSGAPLAFLLAAVIAGMTGLSYSELSSRFPFSGGEAIYVERAFGRLWLSGLTGWTVVLTGIVSAATIASGFAGYIQIFVDLPDWLAICLLVFALTAIAAWGISQSVWVASIMTLIAAGGLVLVVWVARDSLATLPERWPELIPDATVLAWSGISSGAFLAFYAFIGFEDMVNVSEEVKDPTRTMPLAIVLALSIATVLYVLVALVAVLAVPLEELVGSDAPLVTIMGSAGSSLHYTITTISIMAISSTALAQLIMTSRIIYGMAGQGSAPKVFNHLHPTTRTPVRGTLFVAGIVLILAMGFSLVTLAQATSAIVLAVFILVNAALIRIKLKSPDAGKAKTYPMWVPVFACILCSALLSARLLGQ